MKAIELAEQVRIFAKQMDSSDYILALIIHKNDINKILFLHNAKTFEIAAEFLRDVLQRRVNAKKTAGIA